MDEHVAREGPIPLAEEHLQVVSGGALSLSSSALVVRSPFPGIPVGCHACTSGGPIDLPAELGSVLTI
jgi:hypothetical protein